MPRRICLVTYYGLKESLLSAANALEAEGHVVTEFPLYRFMHDQHDRADNYLEMLIDHVRTNGSDLVLWWFINLSPEEFHQIKVETGVSFALFNWDDPYNWSDCRLAEKCRDLDYAFVTCSESLSRYRENGCTHAQQLLPGFDPAIHFPDDSDDEEYAADVSFCCTNLYQNEETYPDQIFNRKQMIDQVYQGHLDGRYIFHIYGPESLKEHYPNSYRGFISYRKSNKVFNQCRISICTHVLGNMEGYLNERAILVGASGGLLLIDPIKGIEQIFSEEEAVYLREDVVAQIEEILNSYRIHAPKRSAIAEKVLRLYSYKQWASAITQAIEA